jgi:DNA polymerase III alpha subunit
MKEFYISDCARQENQTITSLFVVAVKQVKSKKNGELYLSVVLADRSGQLQGNMWDNVQDALTAFEQDDFVKVKGVIHKYNGRWQLTIHKMRRLEDSEIDHSDYLPKTPKDIEQLWRTVSRTPGSKRCSTNLRPTRQSSPLTRMRPRPRRCITPSSAACSITWCRCSRCAI